MLAFIMGYLLGKMCHWSVDSSNAWNWDTNKWNVVIQLIKPLSNWLEQQFTQAASTFDYVYRFQILVTSVCAQSHCYWISHSRNHTVLQNWSRQEINRKRVVQVIRVIVRILLLPRIQWVVIQVIESTKQIVCFF